MCRATEIRIVNVYHTSCRCILCGDQPQPEEQRSPTSVRLLLGPKQQGDAQTLHVTPGSLMKVRHLPQSGVGTCCSPSPWRVPVTASACLVGRVLQYL